MPKVVQRRSRITEPGVYRVDITDGPVCWIEVQRHEGELFWRIPSLINWHPLSSIVVDYTFERWNDAKGYSKEV